MASPRHAAKSPFARTPAFGGLPANRLLVIIRWAWSFLAHGRGTRLTTGEPHPPPIKRPERFD
jgi:hypothetical protein